jgi:hypothetical protein
VGMTCILECTEFGSDIESSFKIELIQFHVIKSRN